MKCLDSTTVRKYRYGDLAQIDYLFSYGNCRGVCPVQCIEFLHNIIYMKFYDSFAYFEKQRNIHSTLPVCETKQDFLLA